MDYYEARELNFSKSSSSEFITLSNDIIAIETVYMMILQYLDKVQFCSALELSCALDIPESIILSSLKVKVIDREISIQSNLIYHHQYIANLSLSLIEAIQYSGIATTTTLATQFHLPLQVVISSIKDIDMNNQSINKIGTILISFQYQKQLERKMKLILNNLKDSISINNIVRILTFSFLINIIYESFMNQYLVINNLFKDINKIKLIVLLTSILIGIPLIYFKGIFGAALTNLTYEIIGLLCAINIFIKTRKNKTLLY